MRYSGSILAFGGGVLLGMAHNTIQVICSIGIFVIGAVMFTVEDLPRVIKDAYFTLTEYSIAVFVVLWFFFINACFMLCGLHYRLDSEE